MTPTQIFEKKCKLPYFHCHFLLNQFVVVWRPVFYNSINIDVVPILFFERNVFAKLMLPGLYYKKKKKNKCVKPGSLRRVIRTFWPFYEGHNGLLKTCEKKNLKIKLKWPSMVAKWPISKALFPHISLSLTHVRFTTTGVIDAGVSSGRALQLISPLSPLTSSFIILLSLSSPF